MEDILGGYRLFSEVVKQGSFAAAARSLDMTPSAVSKAIARMEQRLSARLFYRSTRAIRLTEAGQMLFQRAQGILNAVDDTEAVVADLSAEPRGDLRVACSDAFASHVLVPMWQQFKLKYPRLRLHVLQGDGPIDLHREAFDVAIRFEVPDGESFAVRQLVADPWVVCASPAYLVHQRKPAKPKDLLSHQCLAIYARGRLDNVWHFSGGVEVKVTPAFSGIGGVVKEAALAGFGVARLASFIVLPAIHQGDLVPLLEKFQSTQERSIYAVSHDERPPRKVGVFMDALEQFLAEKIK